MTLPWGQVSVNPTLGKIVSGWPLNSSLFAEKKGYKHSVRFRSLFSRQIIRLYGSLSIPKKLGTAQDLSCLAVASP